MKKNTITALLILLASCASAQKLSQGTISVLKNEQKINFEVDFSSSTIDDLTEDDFLIQKSMEEDEGEAWKDYWNNECKKDFIKKFCLSANQCMNTRRLGAYPDAKYTATFVIASADGDGELRGTIVIRETSSGETIATVSKIHGEGGHFGSIENLIGDGMERAGKQFGKYLDYVFSVR